MKLKIFSLIIIAILAISAIGSVSASTLTLNYPNSKPSPNGYRWTGDSVLVDDVKTQVDSQVIANTHGSRTKGFYKQYDLSNYAKDPLRGHDIQLRFTDGTALSAQLTYLYINNYNGGDVYVNFWDRGTWRYPHIDVTYNGQYKDGGNGNNVKFS